MSISANSFTLVRFVTRAASTLATQRLPTASAAEYRSRGKLFRDIVPDPRYIHFVEKHALGRRRPPRQRWRRRMWRQLIQHPHEALDGRDADIWSGRRGILTGYWDAQNGDQLLQHCGGEGLPEVALVGRSNVGKSSLLNALLGVGVRLSKVENRPGTTLRVSRFLSPTRKLAILDVPGYGFAFGGSAAWDAALTFLTERYSKSVLRRVILLLDARHGMKLSDWEFLEAIRTIPSGAIQVVLTKSDMVLPVDLAKRASLVEKDLRERSMKPRSQILMVSSRNYTGVAELQRTLAKLVPENS